MKKNCVLQKQINQIIPIILIALFVSACVANYEREGYTSQADYELAQQWEKQRPTQYGLDALKSKGVYSKSQFDAAVSEMYAANYPTSEYKSDGVALLDYLSDKQIAEENNVSILVARKKRTAQQQAEQARKEADEVRQKQQYAKEFPYLLVVSCEFAGDKIDVRMCFTSGKDGIKTELELRNGSEYNMYQMYDLENAGNMTRDGLVIPLRNNFMVQAQNANRYILTFTVFKTATMQEVYKKSAPRFGVVGIAN